MTTTAVGTVGDAVAAATDALAAAGCTTPGLDAELLIADALGGRREDVVAHPERPVPPDAARVAMTHVRRRAAREPLAYITGRKAFRRLELEVDRRVLIPRPQSELLVEVGIGLPEGARVHDIGTGCGAIALAIKDERPDLAVSGSDFSEVAIQVARANAARLGLDVELYVADGFPGGDHDLFVANLPYIREDEWPGMQPEIRGWEPREAFLGGPDGLDQIRALIAAAPPGTRLGLEHAPEQARTVRALLADVELPEHHEDIDFLTVGRRR